MPHSVNTFRNFEVGFLEIFFKMVDNYLASERAQWVHVTDQKQPWKYVMTTLDPIYLSWQ